MDLVPIQFLRMQYFCLLISKKTFVSFVKLILPLVAPLLTYLNIEISYKSVLIDLLKLFIISLISQFFVLLFLDLLRFRFSSLLKYDEFLVGH